jgi:hypothetical protein
MQFDRDDQDGQFVLGSGSSPELHSQPIFKRVEGWHGRKQVGAGLPQRLGCPLAVQSHLVAQPMDRNLAVENVRDQKTRQDAEPIERNLRRTVRRVFMAGKDGGIHQQRQAAGQNHNRQAGEDAQMQFSSL